MYKFPVIKTIDDVLPAIKGWDEFKVSEKDEYDVINYNVEFKETFSTEYEGWETRRECRGLIFDKNGKLISRPFHKFFNVNQLPDVHETLLPLDVYHNILVKEDGSMIRPIPLEGRTPLGTKMGETEISKMAENWLMPQVPEKWQWMNEVIDMGYTPIFEYVGPQNRIVLDYEHEDLILLAVRHTEVGYYLPHSSFTFTASPFNVVQAYGGIDLPIDEYIASARKHVDCEGNVVFWPTTGLMVKFKNDWYVQLHKILDEIRAWRHVADKLYKGTIDDVLPKLSDEDRETVENFISELHHSEQVMIEHVDVICRSIFEEYGNDRKRIALEYIANLDKHDKWLSKFIFSYLDGKEPKDMVRTYITNHVGSVTKFNTCLEWLGMEEYLQ